MGSPLPYIDNIEGNPTPSFQCNGDGIYNSGGDSKQTFDISDGLVMETDLKIVNLGIHYNDAAFGLVITEQNQVSLLRNFMGKRLVPIMADIDIEGKVF